MMKQKKDTTQHLACSKPKDTYWLSKRIKPMLPKKQALTVAKQSGLDITKPIAQQVNIAINEIGQILHQLKLQQKDAEELQNKINLLLNEKKKLEIQKTTADKAKVQADKDFYANEQHIHQLHEQKKAGERTAINLFTDLNAILANWMPGWQQDTTAPKIFFAVMLTNTQI